MKKYIGLFVFLVVLDALTKAMAVAFAPTGEIIRLVYNPNATMGLEIGFPYWKEVSLLFLPLLWYCAKDIQSEKYRYLTLAFLYAGCLNNSFERLFSSYGVVDFLNISGGLTPYYCNFADIYQWVGYAIMLYGFSLNKKPETVSVSVKN